MNPIFNNLNCFLLSLNFENNQLGWLSELHFSPKYKTNSFVILPYQNSQTKKPQGFFYEIIKKTSVQLPENLGEQIPILLGSKISKQKYIENLIALKDHIQQGNIYEINYCIEFFAEGVEIDPVSVFIKLNKISKAPYSCLVKINDDFIARVLFVAFK